MKVPVRLILTHQDIQHAGPMQFTLYNVIREGIRAAEKAIGCGRVVEIRWGEAIDGRRQAIYSLEGLAECRDRINMIVLEK